MPTCPIRTAGTSTDQQMRGSRSPISMDDNAFAAEPRAQHDQIATLAA